MEEWKFLEELDIFVSSFGRIKVKKNNKFCIRKPTFDIKGYERISIKNKTYKVHRLVFILFGNKDIDGLTINHIDFNKRNNLISNLEAISASENTIHYVDNKLKLTTTSKKRGVGYHSGINKWTTRVTYNKKRYSLGVFDKEEDAINIIDIFNSTKDLSMLNVGKGKQNIGKSKYSEEDNISALILAKKIGVRKAGKESGMGSTRISKLRLEYKMIEGKFVKDE